MESLLLHKTADLCSWLSKWLCDIVLCGQGGQIQYA